VTAVDWVALGLVLLTALGGAVQGFVWSGLSLAGLLAGAFLGGRLVPVLLSNGTNSRYAPVVALVAGALGFGGMAGAAAGIAKILFFLFVVGFVIFLALGVMAGRKISGN